METYITKSGDTWDTIAKEVYGSEYNADALMVANREHIGTYQFGAGVQTELNQGETFSVGEDGALIVDNIHKPFEELSSSAGGFSDRTLLLGTVMQDYSEIKDRIGVYTGQLESQTGGTKIVSLSELCGRDSIITLSCEYQPF